MRERGEAVRIDARMDPKQLKKLTKALDDAPGECRKGLVSAINRSVKTTNTAMQRAVTQRYNIKKSALSGGDSFKSDSSNNLIKPILATTSKLQGAIEVRGSRLSLVSVRGMITPKEPKSHKGKTMKQIQTDGVSLCQGNQGQAHPLPSQLCGYRKRWYDRHFFPGQVWAP